MRYGDDETAAVTGPLTPAEQAAMTVAAVYADAAVGLGVDKWTLVGSRLRTAVARSETVADLHDALAPELARLGDGLIIVKDAAVELLEAFAVPGLLEELQARPELAILRVRATRPARPKKGQ